MSSTTDYTQEVFYALGGKLETYRIGDPRPLDELYGPRYLGASIVRIEGDAEYDDNNYYTPAFTLLVAPDVTNLKDAVSAAAKEFLGTPEGKHYYDEYEATYFHYMMDNIPNLTLWRHGVVLAYFDWNRSHSIDWDEELVSDEELGSLGLLEGDNDE